MEFKDNLYRIRKEKGMSQEELAALCDVSRQAISKWENGTANPDMENLKILSRSLQVSIDELLGNKIPLEKEVVKEKEVIYVHMKSGIAPSCQSVEFPLWISMLEEDVRRKAIGGLPRELLRLEMFPSV